MPRKLAVLLALLGLSALLDGVILIAEFDNATAVRMAIGVACIVGLLRGSEAARVLLSIGAVIGVLSGTLALIRASAIVATAGALGILAFGLALWAVGVAVFIFVTLRDDGVQQWMALRNFRMPD